MSVTRKPIETVDEIWEQALLEAQLDESGPQWQPVKRRYQVVSFLAWSGTFAVIAFELGIMAGAFWAGWQAWR